jgi:hypothetical protein
MISMIVTLLRGVGQQKTKREWVNDHSVIADYMRAALCSGSIINKDVGLEQARAKEVERTWVTIHISRNAISWVPKDVADIVARE